MTPKAKSVPVPLRQWIRAAQSRGNNGHISSDPPSPYLSASLRIAISLAEQIHQAEKLASCGVTTQLDLLPSSSASIDWADCVYIHVKTNENESHDDKNNNTAHGNEEPDINQQVDSFLQSLGGGNHGKNNYGQDGQVLEPLPFTGQHETIELNDNNNSAHHEVPDLNQQVESYLQSFGIDSFDGTNQGKKSHDHDYDQGLEPLPFTGCQNETNELKGQAETLLDCLDVDTEGAASNYESHKQQNEDEDLQWKKLLKDCGVEGIAEAAAGSNNGDTSFDAHNGRSDFGNSYSFQARVLDYLNVESAAIRGPENELDKNALCPSQGDERRRIFFFGLVLYELFSKGETPSIELRALALSGRAFVSLSTLALTGGEHHTQEYNNNVTKRRQRSSRSGSDRDVGLCQLSFEYLKLMGLPHMLCSLIFNMLDCVYGDLSGDECYTNIDDVTSDLQYIMSKPTLLFKNLDLESLSLTGLQLNDSEMLHEEEFESIRACYLRSVLGSCELAIIGGSSGTGKSCLAQRVGRFIIEQGGLFLSGKFDQMQQNKPFSALASAFDQFCDLLLLANGSDWASLIANKLQEALGYDACYLFAVIPKLSQILLFDHRSISPGENLNALKRLMYLLCQFVEVISTYSAVSVTLFIDDAQWADRASIAVLTQLLMRGYNKFFFIGSCRDDEMPRDHPFWKMIGSVGSFGINSTMIKLEYMTKDTMNELVSDTLCLLPRQVTSLSDVLFKKTKGNLLFFSQLMLSLNRDGLLCLSLSQQRWLWDQAAIQSMKLPDDIAICFTNGINKLHVGVQVALQMLSLFGACAKCQYLETLQSKLNIKLIEPLDVAASEGLVTNEKGSISFCHDRIQEACFNMMDAHVRVCNHLIFGRCLVETSLESGNEDLLFVAVNHINIAGPGAISVVRDFSTMARYNLTAGHHAIEMSDFSSALSFFSHGIKFLPPNYWKQEYKLSLELFELASKSALATGNTIRLQTLSVEVMKNAKSFEDRLELFYIIMTSLSYASKISEALQKGLDILSRLEEAIPKNPSPDDLQQQIQQTQSMIQGVTEQDFLDYRLMTDNKKRWAMRFLAKIEVIALLVNPTLHPFITLRMVQLTISHGLSPMSPVGLVYFGSLLGSLGNIQAGHRFAKLAKSLADKLNAKEITGEVIGIAAELACFAEPLQTVTDLQSQGERASMAAGDVHWGCLNRLLYCTTIFTAGDVKLSVVKEAVANARKFMTEQGHKTSLFFIEPAQRRVLLLMGLETEAATEDELSGKIHGNRNPHQLRGLYFQMLWRYFHMLWEGFVITDGDLKEAAEGLLQFDKSKRWFILSGDVHLTIIFGLSSFRLYRETHDPLWLERGRRCEEQMKQWSEQGSPHNFQHKYELLAAENLYSCGNHDAAQDFYSKAIASAKIHKFINDEALCCELAAKFYLAIGDLASSLEHFRLAHEKYHSWGAVAKADKIFEFINQNFGNILGAIGSLPVASNISRPDDERDQRKRRVMQE